MPDYLIYILIIVGLFIVSKLMTLPIKLAADALYGGALLFLLNIAGGYFAFHIPINIINVFIVGILGLRGVAIIVVWSFLYPYITTGFIM